MKKLLLLLFVSFTSLAQYKEFKKEVVAVKDGVVNTVKSSGEFVVETVNTVDTSRVSKQLYTDVKSVVKSIAKGLGIASEKVYTVITKKYFIEGLIGVLINLGQLIICCICCWKLYKIDYQNLKHPFVVMICLIFTLSTGSMFYNSFASNVGHLLNPEYYTIEFIYNNLKQLR